MAEIIQHQDPEPSSSTTTGIESRSPACEEKHGVPSRKRRKGICKATCPRTAHGKKRSKLNAVKHGLFYKDVLLEDESRAEYASLLIGLMEDLQPQGKLESVLVENLAVLFWRKRRLLQAENALISENKVFTPADCAWKLRVEAMDASRNAITSGGLLKYSNNSFVVRDAIEILTSFRTIVAAVGFHKDCYALQKLYGENQDVGAPLSPRLPNEDSAKKMVEVFIKYVGESDDRSNSVTSDADTSKIGAPTEAECRKEMAGLIDEQIERLTVQAKTLTAEEMTRAHYKMSAAVIPGQDVSDRLMRYESHFSREIDRTLNRLERLQRTRKGQSLPPQLELKIS
jgi:hypothetical protein